MEGDPEAIAAAVARTLSNDEAALAATVGLEQTLGRAALAATAVSWDAEGPRTVDPRALPTLAVATPEDGDAATADLMIGRVLGEGGMGVVLLARQRSLQRDVALKRVREPRARNPSSEGAGHAQALLREAAFTGFLEHPNIVPVHALGRDPSGAPVLVMKRIEGTTLATLLHEPAHPAWSRAGDDRLAFVLRAVRGVCDALSFAHARGVLHRDVKPENVMVGAFGEVYLLDWGVAVRSEDPLSDDAIVGTPVYMAPEMLRPGTARLDARTDVYLVGAMLHEWLAGAPPHHGRTLQEVLLSVARSSPREYPPSVPEELADIARRAMHAEPAARFASADALGQALAEFERHRAAVALAKVAIERLEELEEAIAGARPPGEVEPIFHECRFGLEQSLRAWPENARAQRELRRALVAMTRYQLAQRNLASASSLLAVLSDPPEELTLSVAALERELSAESGERARFRRLQHELDPRVAEATRRRAVRAMGAVLGLFALSLLIGFLLGLFTPSAGGMVLFMGPGLLFAATIGYRNRADLLRNRVNKQMALTIAFTIAGVSVNRVLGWLHGRSFADIASGDCLILSTVAAVSALSLRRVYLVPASLFLIASVLCPRLGPLAFLPILLAAIASVTTVARSPAALREPLLSDGRGE